MLPTSRNVMKKWNQFFDMKSKSPAWIDWDRNEKSNQMCHGSTIEKMFNQTKLPFNSECNVLHKNLSLHNLTTNHSYDFTAQTDTKLICLKWWNWMRFDFTCSVGFNSLLLSCLFSCFPYVQHSQLRVQLLPYGDSIALICAINWNMDASSKA